MQHLRAKLLHSNNRFLRLFLTGFTMGAADIVPGVSGGTVAFLMGIYEELIQSIKSMSGKTLRLVLQGKWIDAWRSVPFAFLIPLGLGLMTAIFSLARAFAYLLDTYPQFLWAFFFGLVLASVYVVSKRVVTWDLHDYIAAGVTTVLAYVIVGAVPIETPNTLPALFVSGAIAICAMILPGISGSFLLVIMGKYEQILSAVNNKDVVTLAIFGLGCVVGLSLFSRVLSYLFRKHHDIVVATLTGFMLGSLRKVWPWKEVLETRLNSHGEVVPLVERNVFPQVIDGGVFISVVLFFVGIIVVLALQKAEVTKEQVKDVEDSTFATEHAKSLASQKHHNA